MHLLLIIRRFLQHLALGALVAGCAAEPPGPGVPPEVGAAASSLVVSPWQGSSSGPRIPLSLSSGFEASGAVFHPTTGRIYVVDDGGWVASMRSDGTNVTYAELAGHPDLEAVASTGAGPFVYVGVEHPAQLRELNATTMLPTGKSWLLPVMPTTSSEGMEGLTFVPNGAHPYASSTSGGVFYASSQRNGRIYVFDVNLAASGSTPVLRGATTGFAPDPSQSDLSDLYFDPSQRVLYVLYDAANRLLAVDTSTAAHVPVASYALPATPTGQEGVTLLPTSPTCSPTTTNIYLASDGSNTGIYSFTWYPTQCGGPPPPPCNPCEPGCANQCSSGADCHCGECRPVGTICP